MLAEREVLISLLKLTKEGVAEIDEVSLEAKVPTQVVKEILKKNSSITSYEPYSRKLNVSSEQRMRIALKAIGLGADLERVCNFLSWLEFEQMSLIAFESADFETKKHFRFNFSGRRWEIDVLGLKKPLIVCVDCKHWQRGWSGLGSKKTAEMQKERTKFLVDASEELYDKINISSWNKAYFVPMILSLVPSTQKIHNGVPVVPVLQVRDFLSHLPAYLNTIVYFEKVF